MQVKLHFLIIIIVLVITSSFFTQKNSYSQEAELKGAYFYTKTNKKITIDSFKGKTILVNLWASWCPPCIKELPSLGLLQKIFSSNKNFEIVAISLDRLKEKKIRLFLNKHGAKNLNLYIDKDKKIQLKLNYTGLPTSFLINKDGQIIKKYEGPFDWDKKDLVKEIRNSF